MESAAQQSTEITIRKMEPRDRDTAVRLSQAESWAHRREDWDFHCRFGRGWVACTPDGSIVGTGLWWPYGSELGTVGMVLVDERYRGHGLGRRLMEAIFEDAGPRTFRSVWTRSGLNLSRAMGFRQVGEVQQWQGVPSPAALEQPAGLSLREVDDTVLPLLCELDEAAFGARRLELLRAILEQGSCVLAEKDGQPVGFGLIRPAGRGMVIGPVVAPNEEVAKVLVSWLLSFGTSLTRIDIPAHATELAEFLRQSDLTLVDIAPVVMRGEPLADNQATRTYAIASQSLG